MFDDLYPEASEAALTAKAARPPEPQPTQRFSVWGMLSAAPKGVAAGAAQGAASGADLTKAVRDKVPANVSGPLGHIPFVNAITSAMQVGADILNPTEGQFTSEVGTSLRNVAKDYTPDPATTHVAESAVFNLFRVGSKALTAAAAGGNIPGAVIAGAEEGFSTADDLARQGVDIKTRTKVGAVTAATNAVGFALPAAGKTWAQTGALALAGGPVSFMAQNQATREILQNADYSKLADQYDPLDPLGLALSTVLPLGFGALAMRGVKAKGPMPDGSPPPDVPPVKAPDDLVDAARVTLLRENMDATNPVRGDIAQADAHVTAYTRAMDQQAEGRPVNIMDVAPKIEPIAGKATDTPNFKAWFGESKVVDDTGAPMVLYHGTHDAFDSFNPAKIGTSTDPGYFGEGFYFTKSADEAASYTGLDGSNVMPVYVSLRNPFEMPSQSRYVTREEWKAALKSEGSRLGVDLEGDPKAITEAVKSAGYDGVVWRSKKGADEYVVFDQKQIKSAIGNSGKFDPNSASLTDNPIADWGAGLTKALDDMAAERAKLQPKPAPALADTAQAATKTVAEASTFNPAALATQASDLLAGGKTAGQVIGELEAGGTKVTPELQNMLVGASEFGGRINDLVDQVNTLRKQRGTNAQPFDLIAQAVENLRTGTKAEAPKLSNPLEDRLAEIEVRNPTALDAEIPVEFDDNGKPSKTVTAREYLDMVKKEAAADAQDANLIEVAANCFLSGGM